jgi:type I restriction enzyme, R subunit
MPFNELNSVEHFVIHKLTGVNLNAVQTGNVVEEPIAAYGSVKWHYVPSELLKRDITEVLLEKELKESLCRLNPDIERSPEHADEVIRKLRAILISVTNVGLVQSNEKFTKWLCNEHSLPFGPNGEHVKIRLIDYKELKNNSFILTNQFKVHERETKIPDVVMFINGIPVVVGEVKTPIRPAISWLDGAHEIHDIYENTVPQLFVPNIFSFATEGKEFYYGSVRCPLQLWAPWRVQSKDEELVQALGLKEIGKELNEILNPKVLLEILQNFCLFSSDKKKKRIKIVSRYQQYDGANKIVDRVVDGTIKQGLIWHFQGSGKSILMVFAAQKLRRHPQLKSPTIIILVDRIDLDTQLTGTFNAADVSNLVAVDSIRELNDLLEKGTRKILITTIHKFKDASANMNTRSNIIVMADEAHRTQEGDLGRNMRAALPNAFYFGLTGTPINKLDKNTFFAFGSNQDEGGYLSRYTFQESIRDNATLPLHFEPRLVDVHVDKAMLDASFKAMVKEENLSEEQEALLSQKAKQMAIFQKSPDRVKKIVEDISSHFKQKVDPNGVKGLIVTPDRFACGQYKEELDNYFPKSASRVIISTSSNDDFEFKQKWGIDSDEQERIIDEYNDKNSDLKFLIVTAKLLTGFDAPILQTMYIDKSIKDHTLLQAICRTNRLYPNKTFGCIVDYFGIFDDAADALKFDDKTVIDVITNLHLLKVKLPKAVESCLSHFPGVDRTIEGFEGLEAAQECINSDDLKDEFAKDYVYLGKLWESLSPDPIINQYFNDYKWLTAVYQSVQPGVDNTGKMLWFALGAQTTKLIHENIHVEGIHDDLEKFVMDADVVEDLFNSPDPKKIKVLEKELIKRFKDRGNHPKFKALSERFEELRDQAEQGLISSIQFIKELCSIAKEVIVAEKEVLTELEQKSAKEALTDLFNDIKTDQTPSVVERIVTDIDAIVKIVRFDGWQTTNAGEREVQKSLRKTLLKYKLHKDQDLFERAYAYVKQYY